MDAFHDFAEMARDYGLVRYFLIAAGVVSVLMIALFLWGRVGDPAEPEAPSAPPAASSPSPSY